MSTPDPVEIKFNAAGPVPDDLARLPLTGDPDRRTVWFLEDQTPGLHQRFPLFHAGVVVRLRREARGNADSTVKLRPCRRTQLTSRWRAGDDGDGWEYKIEADWCGDRRALAASYTASLSGSRLDATVEDGAGWSRLLRRRQRELLAECADIRFDPDALVALGPVAVLRWPKFTLGADQVVAERWTIDGLDFLELSIRVDAGDDEPESRQQRFEASIAALGIHPAAASATKTQQLLQQLAAGNVR